MGTGPTFDNRPVWADVVQVYTLNGDCMKYYAMQTPVIRKDKQNMVELVTTYYGTLDGTSDIERPLARLALREYKYRDRHTNVGMLADEVMIALEIPRCIDALVNRAPRPHYNENTGRLAQAIYTL